MNQFVPGHFSSPFKGFSRPYYSCFTNRYERLPNLPSYSRVLANNEWLVSDSGVENNYAWKPYFIKHKSETYFFKKNGASQKPLYDIQKANPNM